MNFENILLFLNHHTGDGLMVIGVIFTLWFLNHHTGDGQNFGASHSVRHFLNHHTGDGPSCFHRKANIFNILCQNIPDTPSFSPI